MLGADGVRKATEYAILNANYMLARLKDQFDILYTNFLSKKTFCTPMICRICVSAYNMFLCLDPYKSYDIHDTMLCCAYIP